VGYPRKVEIQGSSEGAAMTEIALHPGDYNKLREISELLHDIKSGRTGSQAVRKELQDLVAELMVCVRDDCSSTGVEGVVGRLLRVADHRFGTSHGLYSIEHDVLAEILAAGATWDIAGPITGAQP
jgi:hypothetical protein